MLDQARSSEPYEQPDHGQGIVPIAFVPFNREFSPNPVAQYETEMKPIRHRSALIWVAVAAIAVATLVRAQAGLHSAAAYANPVISFLTAHQGDRAFADSGVGQFLQHRPARTAKASSHAGWIAVFPILFVGLVAPLNLVSPSSVLCLGRTPSSPALPASFQRPPPALLF
jgi:hypothetical protein